MCTIHTSIADCWLQFWFQWLRVLPMIFFVLCWIVSIRNPYFFPWLLLSLKVPSTNFRFNFRWKMWSTFDVFPLFQRQENIFQWKHAITECHSMFTWYSFDNNNVGDSWTYVCHFFHFSYHATCWIHRSNQFLKKNLRVFSIIQFPKSIPVHRKTTKLHHIPNDSYRYIFCHFWSITIDQVVEHFQEVKISNSSTSSLSFDLQTGSFFSLLTEMANWMSGHCIYIVIYDWYQCCLGWFSWQWHWHGSWVVGHFGRLLSIILLDRVRAFGGQHCLACRTTWIQVQCATPMRGTSHRTCNCF